MKSASFTTIAMGIIAAVAATFAAASYPWPVTVTQDAQVSKPLFEDYETSSVRGIEVVAFDSERSEVERIRLKRSGQNWIVPQKNSYDVTGNQRVLQVTRALNGRIVLEVNSDSQTDHVKFGVVDPSDVGGTASRSRLGTKLVLTDRDKKTIAQIIVGDQVKNSPGKYYVRVPGKPTIYAIEFDKQMLTTDFSQWIDPNLLKLPVDNSSGLTIDGFTLNRHRTDSATKQDEKLYEVDLEVEDDQLKVKRLTIKGKEADTDQFTQALTAQTVRSLYGLRPADIQQQSKSVIELLQQTKKSDDKKSISQLADRGFIYEGYEDEGHQFTGTNGEISVLRSDGLRLSVVVGELANRIGGESLTLLYQTILSAEVDLSAFPEIERDEESEDDSESDEGKKVYLRKVKERKERLAAAKKQVQQFNRTHRNWIYVLDESVVNGLFPAIEEE